MNPSDSTREDALTPEIWRTVSERLLTKMLAEFAYEEIIDPVRVGDVNGDAGASTDAETSTDAEASTAAKAAEDAEDRTLYRVELENSAYRFEASERLMDSYHVHDGTVERRADESDWSETTDPIRFLRDLEQSVDLDGLTAGNLVREYNKTLLSDAHIEARERDREEFDPTELDYAHLEGEMKGHPWLTYNKGRLGWGYEDTTNFAPEQKEPVTLSWVAVSKEKATFVSTDDFSHDSLVESELGEYYETFRDRLATRGLDPDDYYFVPIHDWQWDNSIVPLFPRDIATDDIVALGEGPDEYLPQQSVRTFVNVDSEEKHHVKVPMRILNTLVWRGLPGERTELAPTVTEYIKGIYEGDEFLQEEGLILPGEIAGVNYDHEDFTEIEGAPYQYLELLGAVWRESIYTFTEDDEQVITLSALMHVDGDGVPYITRLAEQSGLSMEEWLDEFFDVVLPPLLHFLYKYGTVFSPHGQNTMLVLDDDGVPSRLAVKDFVDDVNVSDQPLPELEALPDEMHEVLRKEPPEGLCQFIFSGLFVCVLRYVADVLEVHHDYDEEQFWGQAREAILAYQEQFPELEDRFELFDLLRPEFTKLSLNRNRVLEYGYEDADGRPHASEHGTVRNALDEVADE